MGTLSFKNPYVRSWQDLETSFPEHYEEVNTLTRHYLGYLPAHLVYTQHLPFLSSLVQLRHAGKMRAADFETALYEHMKLLRNDSIKKDEAIRLLPYVPAVLELYDTFLPQFKDQARRRLCWLLGGLDLPIEQTLCAELLLRDVFQMDCFHENKPLNNIDCEAADMAWYVHFFVEVDQEAADGLDLMLLPHPKLKHHQG